MRAPFWTGGFVRRLIPIPAFNCAASNSCTAGWIRVEAALAKAQAIVGFGISLGILPLLAVGFCSPLFAANPDAPKASDEAVRSAEALLDEALACEIDGRAEKREELLAKAEALAPELPAIKWQRGMILADDKWMSAEEVAVASTSDSLLSEYVARRDAAEDSLEGHLALAQWCQERKLFDQERAHLVRVLKYAPDHERARARLGYVRIDGEWISREEIARAIAEEAKAQTAIKQHGAGLQEVVKDLADDHLAVRERALAKVRAIRNVELVPILERVVAGVSEEASLAVLEALAAMPEKEATQSLARFAVLSSSAKVSVEAEALLKGRKYDDFVPQMLAAMTTTPRAQFALGRGADGRLFYRHAIYQEGMQAANVAVHDVAYFGSRLSDVPPVAGLLVSSMDTERRLTEADFAARMATMEAGFRAGSIPQQELNRRIGQTLKAVSEQDLDADAKQWWRWWERQNELLALGEKPLGIQYSSEIVGLPTSAPQKTRDQSLFGKMSCFPAGTPVLTNRGDMAIEQVRVGDLVLAQDGESGEIAFKPVLDTTVRPPAEILRVEHEKGSFRCTGGHPFWVSGEGWVHARRLKSGMELHTLDGSVRVGDVVSDGSEEAYNLIVADFADYFVSDARILSHDNSSRRPTDAVVPGLVQK